MNINGKAKIRQIPQGPRRLKFRQVIEIDGATLGNPEVGGKALIGVSVEGHLYTIGATRRGIGWTRLMDAELSPWTEEDEARWQAEQSTIIKPSDVLSH